MKIFTIILSLLLLGGCAVQAVQQEIVNNYVNKEELIFSYPGEQSSEYLSESISLYMEYLVTVEDQKTFEQQYEVLQNHFIVEKGNYIFVRWRLYDNVNALIDDIRLSHALKEASAKFNEPQYKELAEKIERTITEVQKSEGYIVDYYDWTLNMPAQRVTLSYLIDDLPKTEKDKSLLENVGANSIFFPEYYDVSKKEYSLNEEVHMIDQLLIAINREDIGISSPLFEKWIIEEWREKEKLFGRYSRINQEPSVNYESLSVYSYLKTYFLKIGRKDLAEEVQKQAENMQSSSSLEQTHFFDYIHFQMMKEIDRE